MRERIYEFHYTVLRGLSGVPVSSLQTKLINPGGLGDSCMIRVLGPHKKLLVEGRCTLVGLRGLLDDGQPMVLIKNVELCDDGSEICLTSKHPHPACRATCSRADLRTLLDRLWAEYSDF